jgi:hypothetical protein
MKSLCVCFVLLAVGLAITLSVVPTPVQALPPRPTSIPTPTSPPAALPASRSSLEGGQIVLRIQGGVQPSLWTVVQWQDGLGAWHDVEGWCGTLDKVANGEGKKTWWVERADLGHGPFRWLVYERPAGRLLTYSASFNLPQAPGQTTFVELTLTP